MQEEGMKNGRKKQFGNKEGRTNKRKKGTVKGKK